MVQGAEQRGRRGKRSGGIVGAFFFNGLEGAFEFIDQLSRSGGVVLFACDLHLASDLGDLIEAITGTRAFEFVADMSDLLEIVCVEGLAQALDALVKIGDVALEQCVELRGEAGFGGRGRSIALTGHDLASFPEFLEGLEKVLFLERPKQPSVMVLLKQGMLGRGRRLLEEGDRVQGVWVFLGAVEGLQFGAEFPCFCVGDGRAKKDDIVGLLGEAVECFGGVCGDIGRDLDGLESVTGEGGAFGVWVDDQGACLFEGAEIVGWGDQIEIGGGYGRMRG